MLAHSTCKRLPLHNALVPGELVYTSSYGGIRGLPRRRIPIMSGSKLLVFLPSELGVNFVIVFFFYFVILFPWKRILNFVKVFTLIHLKSSDLHSQKTVNCACHTVSEYTRQHYNVLQVSCTFQKVFWQMQGCFVLYINYSRGYMKRHYIYFLSGQWYRHSNHGLYSQSVLESCFL